MRCELRPSKIPKREIVYDNMRNVVSKFIGKSEKALNGKLVSMANYCGFQINVTKASRGSEFCVTEFCIAFSLERILLEPRKIQPRENASNQANFCHAKMRCKLRPCEIPRRESPSCFQGNESG
jgi:hypothetical protein